MHQNCPGFVVLSPGKVKQHASVRLLVHGACCTVREIFRIDEIYYILCVLKCILEKVVLAPFFIFFIVK